MQFLTIEHILQIHALVLMRDGGADGVRDIGRLEAAVATQYQEVFGEELYPSVCQKTAAMMRGIIGDYPFSDGNKRTAMLVGLTFLELNGHRFIAKKGEVEDFAVAIAVEHHSVETIATWLEQHTSSVADV